MLFLSSIIINNSIFYLFLFFLISLVLSYLLYRKHNHLKDVPKYVKVILFTLRFFTFFLLFILLLNPEFKKSEKIKESPIIVFLQDNSSSIVANQDSLYYKDQYLLYLDSVFQSIDQKVDVMSFDYAVQSGFSQFEGQTTNLSVALEQASEIYANMNVGAYILVSDGIYNQGLNPIYSNIYLNAPLYTVLIGDTTEHQDLLISSIKHNKITYLGNQTPIEIFVEAYQMQGQKLLVEIVDDQKKEIIYSENVDISSSNYISKIHFLISPKNPGIQKYYAEVKSNSLENNIINNKKSFFIDVIDDRKKILLLFSSPHPDVGVLKESLELHDQYEVNVKRIVDSESNMSDFATDYSLIIAHQLSQNELLDIQNLYQHDIPIWYIVGQNSDLNAFSESQNFVQFINNDNSFEYSNITLNRNFSSFLITDSLSDFLSLSTPFLMPFSPVSVNGLSDVLLYKKIGSLNTEHPILFFVENEYKAAYLLGEGLWRWRLNDTYLNDNNLLFNEFISQIIQYLLLDEEKSRLHIDYQPIQQVSKRVIFNAELYNKNFELTNSYDMKMFIVDSIGNQYDYKFNSVNNKYYLDIGLLPVGSYDFLIEVQIGDEILSEEGDIIIVDFSVEKTSLVANHNLLLDLALTNNGTSIYLDSLPNLLLGIVDSSEFKPKTHINYYFQPIINFPFLLITIIILLFIEWFLRRRYINY